MPTDSSKTVDEIMALVDGALTAQRRATLRTALTSAVIDPAAVREAIAREVERNARNYDIAGPRSAAAFIRQIPLDKLRGD